ncbi:hypothetical protein K450DRAFT_275701 [Umbelopsis ramanniana AG]|uniref:Uncharacterized protein n=1 Tax=Umbelopsis ramanniana AG TaxID=1314678 RepID=A0AAD5E0H3_UMBRA|nr:uncharacterized protein K450DRAFT_275701 [Umbelopsis ramanniana AG]KAI8575346.1 hypothetical protein K450DRAFT_275701 [Umbelopsis ramanniana AG]
MSLLHINIPNHRINGRTPESASNKHHHQYNKTLEEETDTDESIEENPVNTISSSVTIPDSPSITGVEEEPLRRPYENAVLYACQQTDDDSKEKLKTMRILEAMNLNPFSIINEDGTEQNALAHPAVIEKSISAQSRIESTPLKRTYDEMDSEERPCANCSFENPRLLHNVLAMSPYSRLLQKRNYVELSTEYCELLNYDWTFFPHMKYFAAQLLAGSIIHNAVNNETVMANTVEVYGRKKNVDLHREPFGTKKNNAIITSLPPPHKSRYPDVWPTTLSNNDGLKLIIGTQTFNALVTSALRLDEATRPNVGGMTTNFVLMGIESSLSTSIHLDEESIKKAKSLAENVNETSLSKTNIMDQLRQLRTKFHVSSSYYLCRASGPITKSHQCHPYSVFTLHNFDRGRNPAAKIFADIGVSVLKNGDQAVLSKALVDECALATVGKTNSLLIEISAIFVNGVQQFPILGNRNLNDKLEKLAVCLHPYINHANISVEAAISESFAYFKN